MRIHYLQHVPFEGPGCIEEIAGRMGASIAGSRLYAGEELPEEPSFDLLIAMGGPMGVYDEVEFPWLVPEKRFISRCIRAGKGVIGICLGAQLIASALGATVYRNPDKEIGWFPVKGLPFSDAAVLGRILPKSFHAFHWHGDTFDIPDGAIHIASSRACSNQAFLYGDRVMALQFHLESTNEGILGLLGNCGDDLTPGPYVQGREEILDGVYIPQCNGIMERVLVEYADMLKP